MDTALPATAAPVSEELVVSEEFLPAQRFLNRELSWLSFNGRVLECARHEEYPLLERVRFLAISDRNLDEFTAVRVANLKGKVEDGVETLTPDGLSLSQQLDLIYEHTEDLFLEQQQTWNQLRHELSDAGIQLTQVAELRDGDLEWLQSYLVSEILPLLTPLACDPAHPFPFIPNDGLCMALKLKDGKALWSLLPLPPSLPRFIRLGNPTRRTPQRTASGEINAVTKFLLLEDALPMIFDRLFPNFKVKQHGVFHLLRDSDTALSVESGHHPLNLAEHYLRAIKGRKWGRVVRLTFGPGVTEDMLEFLCTQLKVSPQDTFQVDGLLNLSDVSRLAQEDRPDLKFPHYEVRFPERVSDARGDFFAAITLKDFVVHHPYESFDSVVEFLRQAARDPDVVVIKQTLYRTGQTSSIIRALVEAAEAGKSVTVVVELKARFDEEANIRLAHDLERAGAHIVYGFVDKKTHAKMTLVLRRELRGLRGYVHLGTGNYHPVTARTYTDLSYFTSDEATVRDVGKVFNYLTGYAIPDRLEKLTIAPLQLKNTILSLIEEEIVHARAGRPAAVWAKMNALVDTDAIEALYRASQAGVQVELVVRGICCLRPGVPGLSENIRVRSIVGRFLEHARILCVGNGHGLPSKKARVFLLSADWMPRNFETRVETMVPLHTDSVHAQLLEQIMMANLKDNKSSWLLGADGRYRRTTEGEPFSAHEYFMNNPSLSGQGKARRRSGDASRLSLPERS